MPGDIIMRRLFPSFERNGLIHRWIIINTFLLAIVAAIQLQKGWLVDLLNADLYYISHVILAVFLMFLFTSGKKAFQINKMIKNIDGLVAGYKEKLAEKGPDSRSDLRESFKTDLMSFISVLAIAFEALVFIGLIGSVVGLVYATAGIDPQAISDPSNAGVVVSQVISGYGIALHTTLTGAVCGLWIKVNHYMLTMANAHIFSKVLRS